MPSPAHLRVTVKGCYGAPASPVETFSFNLNGAAITYADDTARLAAANSIFAVVKTNLLPLYNINTSFLGVRLAEVDGTGHVSQTAAGAYKQSDSTAAPGSGSATGTVYLPPQVALVVSLLSSRSGPTGKGRVFLPAPAKALGTDFLLPAVDRDAIAAAMKAMLNGIFGASGVISTQAQVVSSKGYMSGINAIKVGRTLDTHRSRRADLPEAYGTGLAL